MNLTAIIVETRTGVRYVDVIKQHMKHLIGWDLCIVTLKDNFQYYLQELPQAYMYECGEIKDANDYNRILTSVKFWKQFEYYDKVLIFQHDSMILRNNISDFLEYDYVGAPWRFQDIGGNGGLSLRSPKIMDVISNCFLYNTSLGNEDLYFCNFMHKYNIGKLAVKEVCSEFSMETIYREGTFGIHAIDKYHDDETCKKIILQEEI
jgi:hypothetical protein